MDNSRTCQASGEPQSVVLVSPCLCAASDLLLSRVRLDCWVMGGGPAFGSLLSSPWSVVLSWCVCCWVGVLCGRGLGPVWGPWSRYIPGYRVRAEGGGVGLVVCLFFFYALCCWSLLLLLRRV